MSFGKVTFYDERGASKTVECETEADYMRELNAGAKWADSEPRRPLNVEGTRYPQLAEGQSLEDFCDLYQRCNW